MFTWTDPDSSPSRNTVCDRLPIKEVADPVEYITSNSILMEFPKELGVFVLFDLILYVHSTIFQLCGTGLPGLNQY